MLILLTVVEKTEDESIGMKDSNTNDEWLFVRPALYLFITVKIKDRTGTSSNPYINQISYIL